MKDLKVKPPGAMPKPEGLDQRKKALKKACQEFESIFTYELLKSMRRTVQKNELFHGGQGEEIYESMLDQEYAKSISSGGSNTLAHLLYQQLSRNMPTPAPDAATGLVSEKEEKPPLWPFEGRLTSEFGWRKDPISGEARFHEGIDLAAEEGTLIRASLPGKVVRSEFDKGYGHLVMLDHGKGVRTLYAHNQRNFVRTGDWVERGAPLGRVGSSGRSTGPHLHYEVRRNGEKMNPMDFLESGPDGP